MSNLKNQWVIRVGSDQVKGPYSTEAVNKMILSGIFSGNEEICSYPEGEWNSLTKQSEFYDALLESLENPVEVDLKKSQKMDAETVIRSLPVVTKNTNKTKNDNEKNDLKDNNGKENKINLDELNFESEGNKKSTLPLNPAHLQNAIKNFPMQPQIVKSNVKKNETDFNSDRDKNLIIQLTDIEKLQKKEKLKLLPVLIFLSIATLLISYYFLNKDQEDPKSKGWALIAPTQKEVSLTDEEVKQIKRKIVQAFQKNQIENLFRFHKNLVQAIDARPKDLEAMGLLCVAYKEIWPFTKQTVKDLRSIMVLTHLTRNLNPISNYSNTCQVVYLFAKGQSNEARSLLEKILDSQMSEKFSLGPFMFSMKAQLYESEKNFSNALVYFDLATQLWPQRISSQLGSAKMNLKMNKFNEARILYSKILKTDSNSKEALFGLGMVEFLSAANKPKAIEYFSLGFQQPAVIDNLFHVESLFYFAKLLIENNNSKKALEVAQKGYQLNPSHKALKEIVILLGGDDKVENSNNEIVLQGDQFARVGDYLAAQAQYKAAFELDPKNANAALKAAKSLWQINQTKDAIGWLVKAIQSDPQLLSAYVLKADYESQKYNFFDAAKTLQEASKHAKLNHEILKGQALLEFRKNNMVGSIQYGEKAMRLYDADVELLTLMAQANIAYYLNAPTIKKEDFAKKEQALADAQRYSGKAMDLEPSMPESQITYAKYLAAKDGPIRGELALKKLIKDFPYTNEYRLALADYYASVEKFSDAAEVYLQVFNIDTKNKKASFGLAESYRLMNKPDMAQKFYNVTSLLDPSDVEPLFSNAKLLLETASGRDAKAKILQAISKLKVVKDINPAFPRVSYYLAKANMELGEFQVALDLIKEEKSKNPNLADPFLLAAEVYYRKEQYKECAAEYAFAIKIRPSNAELYVKASICYRKSEALEIAEDMLAMAKQKESGFPEIYREMGFISEKKGQWNEAKGYFEKYLDLAPNAPDKLLIELKVK